MRVDSELEREYELEFEAAAPGDRLEEEFEALDGAEEVEEEHEASEPLSYADRLAGLAQREFETESDVDREIDDVLGEMERDYFFGGLLKKLKKKAGGVVQRLAKKGLQLGLAQLKSLPAFQAVSGLTQLARGDLRGALKGVAKAGLLSAVPGAQVALPALQKLGLGFEAADENHEGWQRFAELAREAYEELADRVTEEVDDPAVASQIANEAFQTAYRRVYRRPGVGARANGSREITVRAGETIVIRGG
jgi:hypothetical protein